MSGTAPSTELASACQQQAQFCAEVALLSLLTALEPQFAEGAEASLEEARIWQIRSAKWSARARFHLSNTLKENNA